MVVAVLGDQAGLFGRGTSGEGCDAADLRLPGVQEDLLRVLAATGKPVVLVLVTGRPYAIGPLAGQLAAAVQAFFPGEEGGTGDRRGAVRPGGAQRPAPGGAAQAAGRPAVLVPASAAGRPSSW